MKLTLKQVGNGESAFVTTEISTLIEASEPQFNVYEDGKKVALAGRCKRAGEWLWLVEDGQTFNEFRRDNVEVAVAEFFRTREGEEITVSKE